MKGDEGHTEGFSPTDPPLAAGKRLSDEPGQGFGGSFPAPPVSPVFGDVGTGCPWDTAVCPTLLVLCLSLPWEERRGGASQRSKLAALVSALRVNE